MSPTQQTTMTAADAARAVVDVPDEAPRRRFSVSKTAPRVALLGAWAVMIVVFSVLEPDTFLTSANFQTIFGSQAVLLVLALGLVIPLTVGDFDLSVAFLMGLAAVVLAKLNVDQGWPLLAALAATLALGLVVGAVNGFLVVVMKVDSFIVTLGMGTFLLGISTWVTDSKTISGVSPSLVEWTGSNRFLGISVAFWYGVLLCVLVWLVLQHTALGRRLLFVGRGRSVARLSGIDAGRIRFGAFVASGLVSAVAGAVYVGTLGGIDPTSGQSFLLPAFAAAYLGATAIVPGRFNAWGTFIAVYFLVTGITGLQILGVANFVQNLFYGAALVIAVVLSQLVARRQEARDGRRKIA